MTKVFFPQELLDLLIDLGRVDLDDETLVLTEEGLRYEVVEAVRVLREVTTGEDPHGFIGKVDTRTHLEELGGELLGGSVLIEDSGYDVIPGMLGTPVGEFSAGEGQNEADVLTALQNALE